MGGSYTLLLIVPLLSLILIASDNEFSQKIIETKKATLARDQTEK